MESNVFQGHRMPQLGLVTALDSVLCPHKDAYSGQGAGSGLKHKSSNVLRQKFSQKPRH